QRAPSSAIREQITKFLRKQRAREQQRAFLYGHKKSSQICGGLRNALCALCALCSLRNNEKCSLGCSLSAELSSLYSLLVKPRHATVTVLPFLVALPFKDGGNSLGVPVVAHVRLDTKGVPDVRGRQFRCSRNAVGEQRADEFLPRVDGAPAFLVCG